ncbi:MAG: flavin monoamine oxidase family protein [Solirubrobacteraceae bacterium]
MRHDAIVIGAGLAGLSAARDLMAAGTDVVVLEARGRAGGRVEQTAMLDGRLVQLGGEVVAPFHTAYCGLVAELGLTLVPSFPDLPGEETWVLADGRVVGDHMPWMSDADRTSYEHAEREFQKLARAVDPDDPWSHPDAERLDRTSVGAWLRSVGATANVVRARELAMLALSAESVERTSLLSDLRKEAAAGAHGFYAYDVWECQRVAEGSATVPERLAAELHPRVRYGSPVESITVGAGGHGCAVVTAQGERLQSEIVVCAVPAGPLRRIVIDGVSEARLQSLHRARHAVAAKAVFIYPDSFWERQGQNGSAYFETALLGGTWVQREGVMSALVPPERLAALLAGAAAERQRELLDEMAAAFGPAALEPQAVYLRQWGVDPWTLGYITAWRPGDVMAVGPLHGTHAPPFYVCGSDQWVCGYMEGAVRTGRGAARAALAEA